MARTRMIHGGAADWAKVGKKIAAIVNTEVQGAGLRLAGSGLRLAGSGYHTGKGKHTAPKRKVVKRKAH
jgi:hypothetical protein